MDNASLSPSSAHTAPCYLLAVVRLDYDYGHTLHRTCLLPYPPPAVAKAMPSTLPFPRSDTYQRSRFGTWRGQCPLCVIAQCPLCVPPALSPASSISCSHDPSTDGPFTVTTLKSCIHTFPTTVSQESLVKSHLIPAGVKQCLQLACMHGLKEQGISEQLRKRKERKKKIDS